MFQINADFKNTCGKMKPMHAVNNGPVYKRSADQQVTNLQWFIEAGIPYARTHDASFNSTYGGEHTVDVHAIFPDFSKNPYSEDSYDFACTDEYLRVIELSNAKVFYRLGSKIEHAVKKYGTVPPADFKKWAVVCEHIIRHYTEGWANGFNYDIEYWEIWNEPDCTSADGVPLCWQGTYDEFVDFFCIALEHLKKRFPSLKIGGPAFTGFRPDIMEILLNEIKRRNLTLDFLSWHRYTGDPHIIERDCHLVRDFLDSHGFDKTESICNEWNYVHGWETDAWVYSLRCMKSLKGAAFTSATMCVSQYAPLDLLMYYDARPCSMNGLFNTDIVSDRLKGYYPFKMFNELFKLSDCVKTEADSNDLYTCAAKDSDKCALLITYYNDNDNSSDVEVSVNLASLPKSKATAKLYLLDNAHDAELVNTLPITADSIGFTLKLPIFGSYLVVIE